jgi:hypothetical protein
MPSRALPPSTAQLDDLRVPAPRLKALAPGSLVVSSCGRGGAPVTRVLRTVLDSDDRPVEVQATIAAADRHEFRYEVAMDRDDRSY